MEEPGRLQSMGSQRVGHDWATSLFLFHFLSRAQEPYPGHKRILPGDSTPWSQLQFIFFPSRSKESLELSQAFTISNRRRTSFSDSPLYLEVRVDEETLKNVVLHSVATALARRVFPVPGGPTINTPFHGLLMPLKNSGIHIGNTTASLSNFLASTKSAISSLKEKIFD